MIRSQLAATQPPALFDVWACDSPISKDHFSYTQILSPDVTMVPGKDTVQWQLFDASMLNTYILTKHMLWPVRYWCTHKENIMRKNYGHQNKNLAHSPALWSA